METSGRVHGLVRSLSPRLPFMLSDWSITATRGASLIYHPIHPNSHPDVLWPLATHPHRHTHTHSVAPMQIHDQGAAVISTPSLLPILLVSTRAQDWLRCKRPISAKLCD